MKTILPLFIMIDACGWEIVKDRPFLRGAAPIRKRLESVFGYSSTCVPSILSGRWPVEHRNWCYFVYDPERSPFKSLRWFRWLPNAITGRRIFRRWLTRLVRPFLDFEGYFDLYNIPFRHIHLYDFSEKKNPLCPGGMNRGSNIFDYLCENQIPYFVSDTGKTEVENKQSLLEAISREEIDFSFSYWPGLDGLLHSVGNDSPKIGERLALYESWVEEVVARAKKHYAEVRLYVFSDHGMANCDELLDLKAKIDTLGLRMARDYMVVYDSTMARFWFFNTAAREKITRCLQTVPQGRILPDEELASMKALFPDRYFGETIFLVKEGVLIVPSHMGERPIRAMHGYHPQEKHSYATLFTNRPDVPPEIQAIPDIFKVMTREAELARLENHPSPCSAAVA